MKIKRITIKSGDIEEGEHYYHFYITILESIYESGSRFLSENFFFRRFAFQGSLDTHMGMNEY